MDQNKDKDKNANIFNKNIEGEYDKVFKSTEPKRSLLEIEEDIIEPLGVHTKLFNIAIIALVVSAICIFGGYFLFFSTHEVSVMDDIEEIKTIVVNETGPEVISYGKYLADETFYDGKNVSLKGYLGIRVDRELGFRGFQKNLIVDDLLNEIELEKINDFKIFFPEDEGTTDQLYMVSGEFARDRQILIIEVTDIRPATRSIVVKGNYTQEVSQSVMVERVQTVPRFPLFYRFWERTG